MIQIIAILCLAIYGAIISLLVGLKLDIAKRFGLNDTKVGLLFSSFMLAGAIGVVFLSSMIDVLGHRIVTVFGFTFTTLALLLLAFARTYRQTLVMYVVMSVGAMCIISVGNTILPHVLFGGGNESAATNLGNAFYGVGAFLVSYNLTGMLLRVGYKRTVSVFAGLVLVCAVLSLFAEYPVIISAFSFADLPQVLTSSFFLMALITNFFGAGVENGVGSWANTYMSRLGSTDKQANMTLSLFFVAVLVSRLVTATFVTPVNTPQAAGHRGAGGHRPDGDAAFAAQGGRHGRHHRHGSTDGFGLPQCLRIHVQQGRRRLSRDFFRHPLRYGTGRRKRPARSGRHRSPEEKSALRIYREHYRCRGFRGMRVDHHDDVTNENNLSIDMRLYAAQFPGMRRYRLRRKR